MWQMSPATPFSVRTADVKTLENVGVSVVVVNAMQGPVRPYRLGHVAILRHVTGRHVVELHAATKAIAAEIREDQRLWIIASTLVRR